MKFLVHNRSECPEPLLEDVVRLRAHSTFEEPPEAIKEEVLARLTQTIASQDAPRSRSFNWRPWAIGFGITVAVPGALAATSLGQQWLQAAVNISSWSGQQTAAEPRPHKVSAARRSSVPSPPRPAPAERPAPLEVAPYDSPSSSTATPIAEDAPPATPSARHQAPTSKAPSTPALRQLTRERLLLERARRHLSAKRFASALELTKKYRREFPDGVLLRECALIERRSRETHSSTHSKGK